MTISIMMFNHLSIGRIAATASSRRLFSQAVRTRAYINTAKHLRSNIESVPRLRATFLPIISQRFYANGRPRPPGGTHRMDLGGGGEDKPALEKYGVDLTARAKAGKLDPVI